MRRLCSMVLAIALLGCGGAGTAGNAFAQHVADGFMEDCLRARAPTPDAVRQLRQLCSCSEARIGASDIAFGDSPSVIDAKVHAAMAACSTELYGPDGPDGPSTQNSN